ncbi:MAG: hypothetical protein RR957_04685 [Oscillospiraceae bacterium]
MSTKTSPYIFEGTPKKMKIISNCLCYGPCPETDDEVEQHLTITFDGRIYFSSYKYGNGVKYIKSKTRNFKISSDNTTYILKLIGDYFSDEYNIPYTTDVGNWKMTLENDTNIKYKFKGSLWPMIDELENISSVIRESLDMPELLLFDKNANSDRIENITIDYHRITKIKTDIKLQGVTWEYATWDYSEYITIDRKSKTLEHVQNIGSECHVSRKYQVEDGIVSLLESFDTNELFAHIAGNPPDAIFNPLEEKDYIITIKYLYGEAKILKGTFDKNGLPKDFSEFVENVWNFMCFYGIGEILDDSIYKKVIRKINDLIYCNVEFEKYGKNYCYLTEDDSLIVGDYVIVPVGNDNHTAFAKIVKIEYFQENDVPFPRDKVKNIVRKCVDEDFDTKQGC